MSLSGGAMGGHGGDGSIPTPAEPGSASCKPRPPCTDKDYFYTHTACDEHGEVRRGGGTEDGGGTAPCPRTSPRVPRPRSAPGSAPQTQLMFKWAEPKVCSEELPQAAKLPPSGGRTRCPPCNPGFAAANGSACLPCPLGSYSNGSGTAVTEGAPGFYPDAGSWGSQRHLRCPQGMSCGCQGVGGCHPTARLSFPMTPERASLSLSPRDDLGATPVLGCPLLSLWLCWGCHCHHLIPKGCPELSEGLVGSILVLRCWAPVKMSPSLSPVGIGGLLGATMARCCPLPPPGCLSCPAGTEPVLGLEYKWWNVLPPNMETTVLSGINFEYKGIAGRTSLSLHCPLHGDPIEPPPCPCRLGGGRGLHLHSSRSLRQRLHDPHFGGTRLQVGGAPAPMEGWGHSPVGPNAAPALSPAPQARCWRTRRARRWPGSPLSLR